jgi:hypothetical protein
MRMSIKQDDNFLGLSPSQELVDELPLETVAVINAVIGTTLDYSKYNKLTPITFLPTPETKHALQIMARNILYDEGSLSKNNRLTIDTWLAENEKQVNSLLEFKKLSDKKLTDAKIDLTFYRNKIKIADEIRRQGGKKDLLSSIPKNGKYKVLRRMAKVFQGKNEVPAYLLAQCVRPTLNGRKFTKKDFNNNKRFYKTKIKNRLESLTPLIGFQIKSRGNKYVLEDAKN